MSCSFPEVVCEGEYATDPGAQTERRGLAWSVVVARRRGRADWD
jgi:hypothetical protein